MFFMSILIDFCDFKAKLVITSVLVVITIISDLSLN